MASPFQTLPDCVLQRLLAGVPLDDQQATAATCQAFRAVIRGPRFLRLRREFGFAERGVVLLSSRRGLQPGQSIDGLIEIRMAHKRGVERISLEKKVTTIESTTDGGARIFILLSTGS